MKIFWEMVPRMQIKQPEHDNEIRCILAATLIVKYELRVAL
jgi:hypothetical protein